MQGTLTVAIRVVVGRLNDLQWWRERDSDGAAVRERKLAKPREREERKLVDGREVNGLKTLCKLSFSSSYFSMFSSVFFLPPPCFRR